LEFYSKEAKLALIELADAKAHLNIVDSTDDDLIQGKIDAATAYLNSFVGYDIETKYGTGVPEDILEACRQIVAGWYENRESMVIGSSIAMELPIGVSDVINSYRTWAWSDDDAS
jgi:hypothetical protein